MLSGIENITTQLEVAAPSFWFWVYFLALRVGYAGMLAIIIPKRK